MINRSDINLVGNSTKGENIGSGTTCIFKGYNETGNTLQFKTLSVAGGLSVISGTGDTIIISGGSGGGSGTVSGTTDYVPKFLTSNSIGDSSIIDSGSTNVVIGKNVLYVGDGVGSTFVTIKPTNPRIIELIASSGVNIGNLTKCLCFGAGPLPADGLCMCAASQDDLCVHAGTPISSGSGCKLLLSGGDAMSVGTGGNVVICGGDGASNVGGNITIAGGIGSSTGSVCLCSTSGNICSVTTSGSIILSTTSGSVRIPTLPTSTQTNTIYIDGSGNLSKGLPYSGTSYWNRTGGILSPKTSTDSVLLTAGRLLCWTDNSYICGGVGNVRVSAPSLVRLDAGSIMFEVNSASNAAFVGACSLYVGGLNSYIVTNSGTKTVCIGSASQWNNYFCAGSTSVAATNGGSVMIAAGSSTVSGNGGNVTIVAGTATSGTQGNVYLNNLPAKTISDTCVVYINAGKLSYGTVSGGGGLAWQGTTVNGVGTYVSAGLICSQPNMTFNGSNLGITGTIVATSTMTATDFILSSDKRNKTCIKPIVISPVSAEYKQFNFINEPNQLRYGVIAQELQEVHPELVKVDENGMLGVSYTDLLIKEVAYLKCEIKELKLAISEIQNKI
jgi:hypothetical protein